MIDFKTDFAVYSWIGSIVTAILSATFTIAFQTYKENKIQKEQQRAFAILFEAILNDCIIFAIQNPALSQWDNSFWRKNQMRFAEILPEEVAEFVFLLNRAADYHSGFSLSNDNVAKLKAILERVQRRTQRPELGRNHKIIRWLQERISGKS